MEFTVHVDSQVFNPRKDPTAISANIQQHSGIENWQSSTSDTASGTSERVYKTDSKRRARNIESSRKYRKRRREHLQELEKENWKLQAQIEETEKHVKDLNDVFHLFVQHVEHCEKCANVLVCF